MPAMKTSGFGAKPNRVQRAEMVLDKDLRRPADHDQTCARAFGGGFLFLKPARRAAVLRDKILRADGSEHRGVHGLRKRALHR